MFKIITLGLIMLAILGARNPVMANEKRVYQTYACFHVDMEKNDKIESVCAYDDIQAFVKCVDYCKPKTGKKLLECTKDLSAISTAYPCLPIDELLNPVSKKTVAPKKKSKSEPVYEDDEELREDEQLSDI